MFAEFVVLFIGYSHNDPVMNYLSRALVPRSMRYAFVPTDEFAAGHWELLGITPMLYPPSPEGDKHRLLSEAISTWVRFSKMGRLDLEARVKAILESTPPLTKQDEDLLLHALRGQDSARFFVEHARGLHWLTWVDKHPSFKALFQTEAPIGEVSMMLAQWFARGFVLTHPEEALEVIRRNGQRLNRSLWHAAAGTVAYQKPRPDPHVLAEWVAILLNTRDNRDHSNQLGAILGKCKFPGDCDTALLLLEHLARPSFVLRPPLPAFLGEEGGSRLDADVELGSREYDLRQAWGSFFRPNLPALWPRLFPVLSNHLSVAHRLLRSAGLADDNYDRLSGGRSAVEPHDQDRYPQGVSFLIDALRDVFESMLAGDPRYGQAVLEEWASCEVPILRRLAIHGVGHRTDLSPDEKIRWVMERGLTFAYQPQHEVFELLRGAYPLASEATRERVIKVAVRGPDGVDAAGIDKEHLDYQAFNLLVWLCQSDPGCSLARAALDELATAHPRFKPREHPDLHGWSSSRVGGPGSPMTLEELVATDPRTQLEFLATYQGDRWEGPNRDGLLFVIAQAAATRFEWSWRLARELAGTGRWERDLWESLVRGWSETPMAEERLSEVLRLLLENPGLRSVSHAVPSLLRNCADKHVKTPGSPAIDLAENLADVVLDDLEAGSEDNQQQMSDDWLNTAINHPGGILGEFWVSALSKRAQWAGEAWKGIPPSSKQALDKVVKGLSFGAQMARVVLANRLYFLFRADQEWTERNMLPLFDWSRDERGAQQAWHGYLWDGRFNEVLLRKLMPLYRATFPRVDKLLQNQREHFCAQLASIALFSSFGPLVDGWLREFLGAVGDRSRAYWAAQFREQLQGFSPTAKEELWRTWLAGLY